MRPVQLESVELTENVASTYPCEARKKNCTPLLACESVRLVGLVGLSDESPGDIPVNVLVALLIIIDESTLLSDDGRSGVLSANNRFEHAPIGMGKEESFQM